MTRNDAIYLAGLLDGEGCLGIRQHRAGHVHAVVEICMTNRAPLEWARRATGLGTVTSNIERRANRRQPHKWVLSGTENIEAVLRRTEPFMKVKRAEAKALLILAAIRRGKSRPTGPTEHRAAEHALVRISRLLKMAGGA